MAISDELLKVFNAKQALKTKFNVADDVTFINYADAIDPKYNKVLLGYIDRR